MTAAAGVPRVTTHRVAMSRALRVVLCADLGPGEALFGLVLAHDFQGALSTSPGCPGEASCNHAVGDQGRLDVQFPGPGKVSHAA